MAGAELKKPALKVQSIEKTKSPKLDWIQGDIGMLLASYVGSKEHGGKRRKMVHALAEKSVQPLESVWNNEGREQNNVGIQAKEVSYRDVLRRVIKIDTVL